MVLKFSGCLVKEKNNFKSLLASLKTVTNSKDVPKAASEFLFLLFFAVVGQFSPVYCTVHVIASFRNNFLHSRLSEQPLE
jgi:hypothetical protein